MELVLVAGVGCEFAVDGCADVWPVQGVDPEDLATAGARLAGEELDGEVLGEVVGSAGLLAGEVGDVVLADERLAIDGDQWLDGELTEIGVRGELACLPGLIVTLGVALAIIIDLHSVFLGFKLIIMINGDCIAVYLTALRAVTGGAKVMNFQGFVKRLKDFLGL
jgi:hypothetical protein